MNDSAFAEETTASRVLTVSERALVFFALIFAVVIHCGCATVGPDFCGVSPPPVGGEFAGLQGMGATDTSGLGDWWNRFNDPTLNLLLERAQGNNFTIHEAIHRIHESRARVGITAANFRPDVDYNSSYRYTQRSGNADPFVADNANAFDLISVGFDSAWEIDLFGRLARTREAALAELQAAEYSHDDIRISLLAEVASTYVQVRGIQQQLEFSRQNLIIQDAAISLVQEREGAGVSTKLDSEQALGFKFRTEANINQLEQQLEVALNQLSVLMGNIPSDEIRMMVGNGVVPFPAMTGIGVPANILRMRPDVRRAEADVAAASARIGIAEADLYPQLTLLGTISLNSKTASDLFTAGSLSFSTGPALTWNILHFGRITFNIQAQQALMNQKIAAYRESVIQAVREVEDGIAQHQGEVRRAQALEQAVVHDRNAVELSLERYKVGKANFQRVLDAEQQLLQDTLNRTQARSNSAVQMIRMFKAVGGGWQRVTPGNMMAVNYGQQMVPFNAMDTGLMSVDSPDIGPGNTETQNSGGNSPQLVPDSENGGAFQPDNTIDYDLNDSGNIEVEIEPADDHSSFMLPEHRTYPPSVPTPVRSSSQRFSNQSMRAALTQVGSGPGHSLRSFSPDGYVESNPPEPTPVNRPDARVQTAAPVPAKSYPTTSAASFPKIR